MEERRPAGFEEVRSKGRFGDKGFSALTNEELTITVNEALPYAI